MRIGLQLRVTDAADNAIDGLVEEARAAHRLGLDVWLPQVGDVDALTALSVVGREVPGLRVGTAVVPTYPRHPMVMAMQALTVQAATKNHLTLGIGLSHPVAIEGGFGIPYARPVRHMREYLEILMPLLHEGRVAFEGEELSARTWAPMRLAGAAPPTVLVAALGGQMLQLTGRLADGTVLWMVGPKTVESHIVPTISAAAEAAGRPRPKVVIGLPVSVTSDRDTTSALAATTFGRYGDMPSYRAMFDKEGVAGPADVALIGDEETVAAQLRHFSDIGADGAILGVFGTSEEQQRTIALLGELADGG